MDQSIEGKFLFVENIGRFISPNQIYSAAIFHCLINDCEYQTKNVPDFINHLDDHAQTKWSGFCNACASPIHNEEVDLLYELCHFSKTHDKQIQLLPDDILSKLQDVLIAAREQRLLNEKPTPSPSTQRESSISAPPVQSTKNRVQLDEEQSSLDQTSTIDRCDLTLEVCPGQFSFWLNNTLSEQSSSVVSEVQQSEVNACSEESTAGYKAISVRTPTIVPNVSTITSDEGDKVDVKKTTARPRKQKRETSTLRERQPDINNNNSLSETTNKAKQLSEIFNYKCFYCADIKPNPIDIYNHWKISHKNDQNYRFKFTIVKVFKCPHCRYCNTYKELKAHTERKHKGEIFGMIDNYNPKQCGLCGDTIENENTSHFRDVHQVHKIDTELKIGSFLTDELLDRLTGRCTHCDQFFTAAELPTHTKSNHSDIEMNDSIKYGCCQCTHDTDNEEHVVAHIREEHLKKYECKNCAEVFERLDMIKQHHMKMHEFDVKSYGFVDVEKNLDKYELMEIIFANGLVLTKRECKGRTKYGDMTQNIKTVKRIDEKDMAEIRKRQQEELKNESTSKPSENNKKRKNEDANQGRNVKRKASRNVTPEIESTSKPPESNKKRKNEDANEARNVKRKVMKPKNESTSKPSESNKNRKNKRKALKDVKPSENKVAVKDKFFIQQPK